MENENASSVKTDVPQGTPQPTPAPVTTQPEITPEPAGETAAPVKEAEKPAKEKEVWDGSDVNNLPEAIRPHALKVRRYLTKVTQEASGLRKKAEEHDRFVQSEDYKKFQDWKSQEQVRQMAQPQEPQSDFTPAEFEEAQLDPMKFNNLINKVVDQRLNQAIQQVSPIIQDVQKKQNIVEAERQIADFAEVHPDFWDLYDSGILKPVIREVVELGGGTLEDAYAKAKDVQTKIHNSVLQQTQNRVKEKQNAVTHSPSASNEATTIFIDDPRDSYNVAFENAWNKKKVQVKAQAKRR